MTSQDPIPYHKHDLVANAPWFEVLPEAAISELANCARWRRFGAGSLIHKKGDEHTGVYGIAEGRVRASHTTMKGQEVILSDLDPGMWFGELTMLDASQRTHDTWAQEDTLILFISKNCMLSVGERWPTLYKGLFAELSQRMRLSFRLLEVAHDFSLRSRLAFRLVQLLDNHGEDIGTGVRLNMKITQGELAFLCGGSRPKVNKVLKDWEREGLISLASSELVVVDMVALRQESIV